METQIKQKYVDVKHWSYHGEFNHADYHGARILPVAQAHELIDEINQADNGLWQATLVWLTESEFVALPLTDKKGNRAK